MRRTTVAAGGHRCRRRRCGHHRCRWRAGLPRDHRPQRAADRRVEPGRARPARRAAADVDRRPSATAGSDRAGPARYAPPGGDGRARCRSRDRRGRGRRTGGNHDHARPAGVPGCALPGRIPLRGAVAGRPGLHARGRAGGHGPVAVAQAGGSAVVAGLRHPAAGSPHRGSRRGDHRCCREPCGRCRGRRCTRHGWVRHDQRAGPDRHRHRHDHRRHDHGAVHRRRHRAALRRSADAAGGTRPATGQGCRRAPAGPPRPAATTTVVVTAGGGATTGSLPRRRLAPEPCPTGSVTRKGQDVAQAPTDGTSRGSATPTGIPGRVSARLAAAAALISLGLHVLTIVVWPRFYNVYIDTEVYREAGRVLLAGGDLYTGPLVETGHHSLYHVYTPFAALLFTPLAPLPLIPLDQFIFGLNLVLLVASVWISITAPAGRASVPIAPVVLIASLAFWLEPVRTTAWLGQINLLLMLLVLLDLPRGTSRWPRGLGIGLAAGIKLTPLIFIPYLLLTGRSREALVASSTALGTVGVGFLVAPDASAVYWSGVFLDSARISDVAIVSNQSFRGMLARLGEGSVLGGPAVWWLLAIVLGVAGLAVAARLWRVGEHVLGTALCGLTACAVSPFSWGHHWVWFVPLLALLCLHVIRTGHRRSAVAITALLVTAGSVLYGIRSDGTPAMGMFLIEDAGAFAPLTENIYCWVHVAVLAYSITVVRARSRHPMPCGATGA
ncbi:MAG: DUF2029 domain-containing protein [Pseudonocardiaceae bacterium]|nr:DUF2029 domain-containing protein [Pseudonocardiaceae bacterium]